jgi:hypothetical protein
LINPRYAVCLRTVRPGFGAACAGRVMLYGPSATVRRTVLTGAAETQRDPGFAAGFPPPGFVASDGVVLVAGFFFGIQNSGSVARTSAET